MIPVPLIAAGINAAASVGSGLLARKGNQETKMQKQKRELIDDLLASVKGGGSYNDLFASDYDAFQKSYVDPAKSLFNNQIAPQIQQQYIYSGQQRGTGLDDTLARAGVDMDQLLNQQYGQFQENALNRKFNAINGIMRSDNGAEKPQSYGEAAMQGGAGYLNSEGFQNNLNSLLDYYKNKSSNKFDDLLSGSPRKGFAQ